MCFLADTMLCLSSPCPSPLPPRDTSLLPVDSYLGSRDLGGREKGAQGERQERPRKGQESWKVNRVLANQKTEKHREYTVPCNIPFAWFLMKGYNRQDRDFIR